MKAIIPNTTRLNQSNIKFVPLVTHLLKLLASSPIVLCLSLHTAITYGYIYILFTTAPNTFKKFYAFSLTAQGISFIGLGIELLTRLLISGILPYILNKRYKARGIPKQPEPSLPMMMPRAVALPIGLLLYRRSAQRLHYMVPILGTGFIGMGQAWLDTGITNYTALFKKLTLICASTDFHPNISCRVIISVENSNAIAPKIDRNVLAFLCTILLYVLTGNDLTYPMPFTKVASHGPCFGVSARL
jgi:hypothetical protein